MSMDVRRNILDILTEKVVIFLWVCLSIIWRRMEDDRRIDRTTYIVPT